jgi:DNA-binding NarL/FixJ family response regulator
MGDVNQSFVRQETGVFLLTENRLLRESLARLLQKRSDIRVLGVSRACESTLRDVCASRCQVLLTDRITYLEDSDQLSELAGQLPELKVVLFGMDDDPSMFLKSASLGICGYVLKDASAAEIIAAVRAVAQGEAACPPKLLVSLIQHTAQQARNRAHAPHPGTSCKSSLTHRQLELVDLVAKGLTNKEIASSLNLSEFTVKNHLRRIMRQVDAQSRTEAVDLIRASGTRPLA